MLKPYWTNGIATLYEADARALPLADKSVHCCVTSPPYWGLRDYGLGQWQGGDAECGHEGTLLYGIGGSEKQRSNLGTVGGDVGPCQYCGATKEQPGIGLEPTLGEWVANIVAVGREVWRVLRDDGSFWLNLGDAYSNTGVSDSSKVGGFTGERIRAGKKGIMDSRPRAIPEGMKPKNLMGQPWRVAFALQDDGWILRSAIVWHKPNPMPESVTDRPTNAYEIVFLLAKSSKYFYDAEAIRTPSATEPHKPGQTKIANERFDKDRNERTFGHGMTNSRNVWSIPTQGRPDAHFATFPDELPRRCILAGTSERGVCADCGAPWVRQILATGPDGRKAVMKGGKAYDEDGNPLMGDNLIDHGVRGSFNSSGHVLKKETLGWQPTCGCNADTVPATVLDPFAGSGTTLAVAQSLGRESVGTDLNREYLDIASKRIGNISLPLPLDLQPTTDYQTSFQEAQEWTTYRTESS